MNLIHTGSGSNELKAALEQPIIYFSVGGVQYAVQPYDSIAIPSVRSSDSEGCIFESNFCIRFRGPKI
jgi:hypothetical protein